ncbi:MAG: recombinase family protein [Hyphomicrobiales bacterium]|nr:recombinase family protein [Nitratireductor sp.]MCC2097990.1 recombinase family protein [Hyphomicrobiales bacterium]
MKRIAYLRVSTSEQKPDRQIDGLNPFCDELHIETVSAVSKSRPTYDMVMRRLKPGDVFVVWALDRAWRSTKDALNEIDKLKARGIGIHIASMSIDTSSPFGKLLYIFISALAEFERDLLSERTKEGMAAARARGKRIGRPPKLSRRQLENAARRLADTDESINAVAGRYGVSGWTLSRALKREGLSS